MGDFFQPSAAIGSTDQPDSPIVSADDADQAVDTGDQNVCFYKGITYSDGGQVCSPGGHILECRSGKWVELRDTCSPPT